MMDHPLLVVPAMERWATWDRFIMRAPGTGFMQSSWWAEFRSKAGYRNFGVLIRRESNVLGGGVVHLLPWDDDHCFYYIPEGPVLPADDELATHVTQALFKTIRGRLRHESFRPTHLRIEPRLTTLPAPLAALAPVPAPEDGWQEPRHTLCVDLRHSETTILARMRPKGRYNVSVARRHGVVVTEDPSPGGVEEFLRIYHETTDRKHLDGKPDEYFHELLDCLRHHGTGSLYFAERDGLRLAAAIVIWFGPRATYFFGGSLARDRQFMAPYLLHFEIMRRAKARGCEWYDLWGVAPEDVPDHPWQAITEFKLKFGGERLDLVPTLDIVLDQEGYDRYLRRASR